MQRLNKATEQSMNYLTESIWKAIADASRDFPTMLCGHKANNYDSLEERYVCCRVSCFGKTNSGYDKTVQEIRK